jgi:hypothetical protein
MVRTFRFVMFVTLWLAAATSAAAQAVRLTSKEAKNHVGEKATVCGKVAGIHFVSSGKGQPTFIHFDEPYPDQIFTLVIWGSDRPKFGRPEEIYRDKDLCVTGKITVYLGIPEIVATAPNQVQVQKQLRARERSDSAGGESVDGFGLFIGSTATQRIAE